METVRIGENDYSRTKIRNNILKVYKVSVNSEQNDWYREAHQFGVEVSSFLKSFKNYDVTVNQVLGIVSALSPLKEWEKNKEIAVDFILTGDCGHMGANKRKARAILDCDGSDDKILEILSGPKTSRFYMNMMYPDGTGVTVDRHAIAIAIGRTATNKEQALTPKAYTFIEKCYIMTAETLGLDPLHLQSITWQAWKRIK
jgi:hypothetical protein|tara:strand:- start:1510 stop:2109 length:600 start_codon:yes stop_codon:yes gene_type:complete